MKNKETAMKLMQTFKKIFLTIAILSIAVPGISAAQSGDGQYIVIVGAPTAGKSKNSKWISKERDAQAVIAIRSLGVYWR
jgi:hypothetical protein